MFLATKVCRNCIILVGENKTIRSIITNYFKIQQVLHLPKTDTSTYVTDF
jgi:hypothetical protein